MNPDILEHIIRIEGGWQLTTVKGDRGGQTYAGISRVHNGDWYGWDLIDQGDRGSAELKRMVAVRYRDNYWKPMRLSGIEATNVARSLMSCAVVSGVRVATMLAQVVVDVTADGFMGPVTQDGINTMERSSPALFNARFALARIARHNENCGRNPSQMKFLRGWINRALGEV